MKLNEIANQAAIDIGKVVGTPLTELEKDKIAAIVGRAMEGAVQETSNQVSSVCNNQLIHDQDLAHKIQADLDRKKLSLIANLSSLR